MSFTEDRKILTREKRISTLSHYNGTVGALVKEISEGGAGQKIRTFSQSAYDEIICALQAVSSIRDAAVVIHGVIGCSIAGIYFNSRQRLHVYSTNLSERDAVLGSEEKLRDAIIRAAKEQHPKVIFIVQTPVVSINNDDVNSVILELEEELSVKLISIYTDGFKSKCHDNGYDIVLHSLLRYVVDGEAAKNEKDEVLNVISLSENIESLGAVVQIMEELKIKYRILPRLSSIEKIKQAGKAKASVVLNPDEGAYFAEQLEEVYGVKYLSCNAPIGIENTGEFIRKIAGEFGKEAEALEYISKKEAELEKAFFETHLQDKTFFLDMPLCRIPSFMDLIEGLGGTVTGIGVPYADKRNRKILEQLSGKRGELPLIIGKEQPFEKINFLAKNRTDFYLTTEAGTGFAAEQGCIPVNVGVISIFGYEGVRCLIKALRKKRTERQKEDSVYKPMWLKRSGGWFVKQEVK